MGGRVSGKRIGFDHRSWVCFARIACPKVGLEPGDKILEVDGKPVKRFLGMNDSVSWNVVRSEGDKIAVKFERDGNVQTVWVEPYQAETRGWRRKSVRQLLIYPAETPIVDRSNRHAGAEAGLQPGDIIRGIRSNADLQSGRLWNTSASIPAIEIVLHVERGGENLTSR